jgi:DNA-binding transcriptional regulator GbsR (MarR family)
MEMDRSTAIFVDGIGTGAATSGILTQLQGRIFGLLYLQQGPLSLDEIAETLQQSKSNISVQIRGLADWHLVRLVRVPGSRRDHYEAATDFWRVMQEIMERRFRWNLRQVLATVEETQRAVGSGRGARFLRERLRAIHAFASAVDAGIEAVSEGQSFEPQMVRSVLESVPIEEERA